MIRLIALCLVPVLLALPAAADCLDDLKAQLARIEMKLAAGSVPPPTEPEVPPAKPPASVTVTSGPSCNYAGPYAINGRGTVYNVCACPSVPVTLTNIVSGSTRLVWAKMPGTGTPSVPLGMVTVFDGDTVIGASGSNGATDVGLGNRTLTFKAERCTNLVVEVR